MAADNETLAAISAEIRARAGVWIAAELKQYDLQLADRIDAAAKRERGNLDALERACENVLDAETLKKVVAAKRRIVPTCKDFLQSRRSIKIPVEVVPVCNLARAQRRLELLRTQMLDMVYNSESGDKVRFNPRAVADEINDTLAVPPRNCDMFEGDYKMLYTAWFDWTGSPRGHNDDGTVKLTFGQWLLEPAEVPNA